MLNANYPASYSDANGKEETIIRNDGETLRMRVRGVEFYGKAFFDLEPEKGTEASLLAAFCLIERLNGYDASHYYELCNCTIECNMPLPMRVNGRTSEALLHVRADFGVPDPRRIHDKDVLHLTLHYLGGEYRGRGTSGWFEDEMLEIQQALPEGAAMLACINCAYSDYNPAGHGAFGSMACFRDNKSEYLRADSKDDIFLIWDTLTEHVQETYVCPEFEPRRTGAGYRG